MPATGKSTKRKHTSLSSTSTRQHSSPAPSSSPDPPLRISLSYGPLSDNHASIAGMLPTRALSVMKDEIRQLCTQLAPAKPRPGLPHKAGHVETASLHLCYGFGKDRTNAGRWYSRVSSAFLSYCIFSHRCLFSVKRASQNQRLTFNSRHFLWLTTTSRDCRFCSIYTMRSRHIPAPQPPAAPQSHQKKEDALRRQLTQARYLI